MKLCFGSPFEQSVVSQHFKGHLTRLLLGEALMSLAMHPVQKAWVHFKVLGIFFSFEES